MDLLNIDLRSFMTDAVDILTYLYGDKYRNSIKEKLNKAILFYFYDLSTLKGYADDYEKYYAKKSAFQFLKANGISEDKLEEAFSSLISNPDYFASGKSPILAFGKNYTEGDFSRTLAKVQVINYLLESSKAIELEDLDDFSHTEDYKRIETLAKEFNEKYGVFIANYQSSCTEMQRVKDFVAYEKAREGFVRQYYAKKFCTEIMFLLPQRAQDVLSGIDEEQLVKIFLPPNSNNDMYGDLNEISCFEAFSKKNLNKLNSPGCFHTFRRVTTTKQKAYLEFLKELGIRAEDLDSYVPGEKEIQQIARTRVFTEREATDNYLITRDDFIKFQNSFGSLAKKDTFFTILKAMIQQHQAGEYDACVFDRMYDDDDNFLRSIMLYSVKKMGDLFYMFLHECTHICEQRDSYSTGFDTDYSTNQYNEKYRRYERFNETISDIFTREGLRFLHGNGKFLMEPEELTNMDFSSNNTPAESEELLKPLMHNPLYREAIIEVKNGGDPNIFIQLIGKDNFDRLVDVLNHVDYLASKKHFKTDQRLKDEYDLVCNEAESIYKDIDDYAKRKHSVI